MDSQRRHPGSSSYGGNPLELPQSPRIRGRPPRRRVPLPLGAGRGEGSNATDQPGSTTNLSQRSLSPEF